MCVFDFDSSRVKDDSNFYLEAFKVFNFHNVNENLLDSLEVEYRVRQYNGVQEFELIIWRFDNPRHKPYLDAMFTYMKDHPNGWGK